MTASSAHAEFASLVAEYYDNPLGYVLDMFPWGESGELINDSGPDVWQMQLLMDIGEAVKANKFNGYDPVAPLRFAVASGHGIGKGVMMAWLACWIMDTRPNSQGTITANTGPQLASKTWPAVQRWRALSLTAHWWVINSEQIYNVTAKEQWFLKCQTCAEENSEAFAGQHKKDSTSYYLFDEASAIPAKIWEKADGGLTDGEPMFFAFGNPTRNSGEFYEVCFGGKKHRWNSRSIDSRTCRFPNKAEIDQWIQDYGIDSDRIRYMVLGLPPQQSELQLIGRDLIESAQQRNVYCLANEPLVAGVDVPDGGSAWFIVRFRRGLDARSIPPIRVAGSRIDRQTMVAKLASLLAERDPKKRIAMMFIDSAFGAPLVERLHTLGYANVTEVNFGSVKTPDPHFNNMRSFMWGKEMKDWLERGGIDKSDTKLVADLMGPGWHYNKTNQILLESKEEMRKRGIASPDDGDALALTFAHKVAPIEDDSYSGHEQPMRGPNAWQV